MSTLETPNQADVAAFRARRSELFQRIGEAARRGLRAADAITLVAVSKTVPIERIRAAVEAGFTTLGENRVQELVTKAPQTPGASWHLIGPLQSNKARRAVEVASVIQSVESVELARRLDRIVREVRGQAPEGPVPGESRLPVFLQVNVDEDPAKFGFQPDALPAALDEIASLAALDLVGLMTIGRLVASPEDARPTFAGLRDLAGNLRTRAPFLGPELSMGMSDDYTVAIEEGATVVRVGRAIFGDRPTP